MLITSLALLARSRAWVVFRWVGAATPAQRCVRGIAQRMAAGIPDRCGLCRGCRATARTLRHKGSGCGLCGLIETAVPPLSRGQVVAWGGLGCPVQALDGTRSLPVTLRVTARPRCRRVA